MSIKYIKAVPGAGKTKTLIEETFDLMKAEGVEHVAAITFTDRASRELRERIKNKAMGEGQEEILKKLHIANIGTIHNFCNRIIRDYGYHINLSPFFEIMEEGQFSVIMRRRIRTYVLSHLESEDRKGKELRRVLDLFDFDIDELIFLLENFLTETYLIFLTPIILEEDRKYFRTLLDRNLLDQKTLDETYSETFLSMVPYMVPIAEGIIMDLANFKQINRIMDFDDLQLYALKIIQKFGEKIANEIKYILVDEFQDTDRIQISILREMEAYGSNLIVVGDPNQSIYSFRGAHPLSQDELVKDVSPIILNRNYRSSKKLVEFYNASFPKIMPKNYSPMEITKGEDGIVAICDGDQWECAIGIISNLKSRGINDIAVLSRRGNNLLSLKKSLNEYGFDAVILSGESITFSPEALDIYSLLYYLYDPSDLANNLALAISPIFNLSLDEVFENKEKLKNIIDSKLKKYREMLRNESLRYVLNRMLIELGYIAYLYATPNYTERVDRLYRVLDIIDQRLGEGDDIFSLVEWLRISWDEKITGPIEDLLIMNKDFVKIMTVHQAKGLEFDAVLIFDMEEGNDRGIFIADYDYGIFLKSKNSKYRNKSKVVPSKLIKNLPSKILEDEEEKRILYVALTRAKKELYMLLPQKLRDNAYDIFLKSIGISIPVDKQVEDSLMSYGVQVLRFKRPTNSKRDSINKKIEIVQPAYSEMKASVNLDENMGSILSIIKERNASIVKFRAYESGSLITVLSDGTTISELKKKEGSIFVENGKIIR